ncbi:MAG: apolipoprotein N-acyltransferase [Rhodobacteraceae bacterium]|nr:apolipoprotein N-acyltransferase [Paracoccaceae bacterium]
MADRTGAAAWLRSESLSARLSFAVLVGALAGTGQAPVSLWLGGLAGLYAGLALFLSARTTRRAALIGWGFGTGYFMATLFWILEPFFVDAARHGWMAPFALFFLAAGLALFFMVAFGAAKALGGSRIAWAFALALAELARGYVLTGFPWAMIGYIWTGSPVIQWAALFGPYGLTLVTLLIVGALHAAIAAPRRWVMAPGVVVLFALAFGAGAWREAQPVPGEPGPVLRVIQPNAAQHLKWDPRMAPVFFERQLQLTAEPADPAPRLVIWPETAIPDVLDRAGPMLSEVAKASGGVPVVLGIQRRDGKRYYNSLILNGPGGVVLDVYDKHHLVPFGEYVPLGELGSLVGLDGFRSDYGYGFSSGPGPRLIDLGPFGTALPLICYEAIFPQDARGAGARPGWLLQITNDAWFGTLTGPYQHLAQARVRAVELGLPLVRSANTGVSAVIDARGRIVDMLPLGVAGRIDAALPPALPPTPYARTGDLPILVLLLAGLFATWLRGRGKSV